jgi:hypothetical protein
MARYVRLLWLGVAEGLLTRRETFDVYEPNCSRSCSAAGQNARSGRRL